jgi:hypothetical protein
MAFSLSPTQTVLWDQIHYSGDPTEFAWVLPVRAGARLELSRDEFFAALDASTQPVVTYPYGGPGCAVAGCGGAGSAGTMGGGSVEVLAQRVVGPYETVTLRSTDPNALVTWLDAHQFELPVSVQPTVEEYVREGFDFIALRLRPQCSERSMQPVRVITPGADPTLPLRMVAAGVGARVGIVLYVLGEGRWRPQNFDEVLFDDSKLVWDSNAASSNYESLAQSLMAQNGGRSFLTEAAQHPDLASWYPGHPEWSDLPASSAGGSNQGNPGLASAYFAFCRGVAMVPGTTSVVSAPQPCAADAGEEGGADADADADAGMDADAGPGAGGDAAGDAELDVRDEFSPDAAAGVDALAPEQDAGDGEAGLDAPFEGTDASPAPTAMAVDPCSGFDDLDVAFGSLHLENVWVTRLRANLPATALASDLRLEAEPVQEPVSNLHVASSPPAVRSRQGCVSTARPKDAFGTVATVVATMFGISIVRRRRRK